MILSTNIYAEDIDASFFHFDNSSIEQKMLPLTALEQYVVLHEGITYDEINEPLILDKTIVLEDVNLYNQSVYEETPIIVSILGCILLLLLVYMICLPSMKQD